MPARVEIETGPDDGPHVQVGVEDAFRIPQRPGEHLAQGPHDGAAAPADDLGPIRHVRQPLQVTATENRYDVLITVAGGGPNGQAGAVMGKIKDIGFGWVKQQVEWFGDRWPEICSALYDLDRIGIYYRDTRPGNIMFPDDT